MKITLETTFDIECVIGEIINDEDTLDEDLLRKCAEEVFSSEDISKECIRAAGDYLTEQIEESYNLALGKSHWHLGARSNRNN